MMAIRRDSLFHVSFTVIQFLLLHTYDEIVFSDRLVSDPETKRAVADSGIVLVEGFTDAMKLVQEGFPKIVALMSSSMNDAQKAIARQLLFDAWLRYVDCGREPRGSRVEKPCDPEHFTKEELAVLLGNPDGRTVGRP